MSLDYSSFWVVHMLSKVHYGDDCLKELKLFSRAYEDFRNNNGGFKISGIDKLFRNILAYHKANIYKDEKEIRLLYSANPYKTDIESHKFIPMEFKITQKPEHFSIFTPT